MKDWRPIALYKIVANVLANIFKHVLHKYVSHTQSTFVYNKFILDNAMTPLEIVYHMKTNLHGRVGDVSLKLDINNAYDRPH